MEMMKLLVISLLFSLARTEEGMSDLSTTTETATSDNVDGKVTCIAPSTPVEEGKDISITCHFPFDVSQENSMSVDVYWQPNNGDREPVAWCDKPNTETFDCDAKKGYSIEGEVKTSLKLHIMNISTKHNGLIFCQIMPEEGKMPRPEFCSLSVHGVSNLSNTSETTTFADVDDGAGDVGLYVGVFGGILVVVIIIIVYCCWYRNRNSRNKPDVENSGVCEYQNPADNRQPPEGNCRDDGEVEDLMPPKEDVQQDDGEMEELVPPVENVQQDDGEMEELVPPVENVQQDDGEAQPMLPEENGQQDGGEVQPMLPEENVQQLKNGTNCFIDWFQQLE